MENKSRKHVLCEKAPLAAMLLAAVLAMLLLSIPGLLGILVLIAALVFGLMHIGNIINGAQKNSKPHAICNLHRIITNVPDQNPGAFHIQRIWYYEEDTRTRQVGIYEGGMSNIIRVSESSPNGEWLVISNVEEK